MKYKTGFFYGPLSIKRRQAQCIPIAKYKFNLNWLYVARIYEVYEEALRKYVNDFFISTGALPRYIQTPTFLYVYCAMENTNNSNNNVPFAILFGDII